MIGKETDTEMGSGNQKGKGKWEEARGRGVSGWVVLAKSGMEKGLERVSITSLSHLLLDLAGYGLATP